MFLKYTYCQSCRSCRERLYSREVYENFFTIISIVYSIHR